MLRILVPSAALRRPLRPTVGVMDLILPAKLQKALEREAQEANLTLHAHIVRKLERITPPVERIKRRVLDEGLPLLVAYLSRVPSIRVISSNVTADAYWWIKLNIDVSHPLAWNVVQELGFVLNYISVEDKLPTVFMPVSPPPYLNGGPSEFLSWAIESRYSYIDPEWIANVLEGRLPRPVDDLAAWADNPPDAA
jgi:hypothetical protein